MNKHAHAIRLLVILICLVIFGSAAYAGLEYYVQQGAHCIRLEHFLVCIFSYIYIYNENGRSNNDSYRAGEIKETPLRSSGV